MKYDIEKINRIIESGEPIFILRAQDNYAVHAIEAYLEAYRSTAAGDCMRVVENDFTADLEKNVFYPFLRWRKRNPDQCKMPD